VLPIILSSPRAGDVASDLLSADSDGGAALTAYGSMDYLNTAISAKSLYEKLMAAAARINVHLEPQALSADYRRHIPNRGTIDPVNAHAHPQLLLSDLQTTGYLPIR
jgi:hypothetical protein